MKRIAIGLFFAAALVGGCQQRRYFVDLDQAIRECYDGKQAAVDIERARVELQRQADEAAAAAKKAEDAGEKNAPELRQRAEAVGKQATEQFAQFKASALGKLGPSVRDVLDRVAADRRVAVIERAPAVAWFDPSLDVTLEVIRRLDANSSRKELDDLRAKAAGAGEKQKAKP